MSDYLDDYINYRISKSQESLSAAKILAQNESWNACTNRLYYACYYSVTALLLKNHLKAQTHSGIKTLFHLHFIKTGKVKAGDGKLYDDLLDWRYKGDYGDMFDLDKKTVEPLIPLVESFIDSINVLLRSNQK